MGQTCQKQYEPSLLIVSIRRVRWGWSETKGRGEHIYTIQLNIAWGSSCACSTGVTSIEFDGRYLIAAKDGKKAWEGDEEEAGGGGEGETEEGGWVEEEEDGGGGGEWEAENGEGEYAGE